MLLISTPLTFCFRFSTFGGFWKCLTFSEQLGTREREREREKFPIYIEGDPAEIAIIRITLLGFLLHFLFDLLRSPKGSWVGT